MKLPEPTAWLELSQNSNSWFLSYGYNPKAETQALYTEAQLKQALKDVLEQAAQEATDAIAFNGGTVQMEAHVREAIRKLKDEI